MSRPLQESPQDQPSRKLKRGCRIFALALGAATAWGSRFAVNTDGVSYLDLGDAFFRFDWAGAVNSYWSPGYPAMLKLVLAVLRPSAYWEAPAAHLANLLIYAAGLACLEWLLRELIRYRQTLDWAEEAALPNSSLWLLGYAVYVQASVADITLAMMTPDLAVAACLLALSALALRLRSRGGALALYLALGLLAASGYLIKAILFPLAFVYIALATWPGRGQARQAAGRATACLCVFGLLAAAQVYALHRKTGRWTFGDSGRLNYAMYVSGLDPFPHWHGWPRRLGKPRHAPKRLRDPLDIYVFSKPIGGSYPLWYDPVYWYEGARARFELATQTTVALESAELDFAYVFKTKAGLASVVVFFFLLSDRRRFARRLAAHHALLLPALSGLVLYGLVHVETRYIAPFMTLLLIASASAVAAPRFAQAPQVLGRAAAAAALTLNLMSVVGLPNLGWRTLFAGPREHTQWQVAESLTQLGLRPGEPVASLGVSFGAYWARLARARIIAEAPRPEKFWNSAPEQQATAVKAFAGTGAKYLVAKTAPAEAAERGWIKIAATGYYALPLQGAQSPE